jgi:Na+/H+ antiporter NhaA
VRLYRLLVDNSALLLAGALIALVWANLAPVSYGTFAHALHFATDDIGMLILLVFGLVNAGVPLASAGPATWAVAIAVMTGKPLGIALTTILGRLLTLELADGISWRDVLVVGTVSGIGFTVALFFAAAFPPGPLLDQTKMGALASFAAALAALRWQWC